MAEKYQVNIEVKSNLKTTETDLKSVNTALQQTQVETDKLNNKSKEASGFGKVFGDIKNVITGMVPGLKGAEGGVNSLSTSFKALLANPVVLVVTGIIASLKFLYEAFQSSVEGGKAIKQVWAGIELVGTQVKDAIFGLARALGQVVVAFYKFQTLDFKGASEAMKKANKEATNSFNQLGDAVDGTTFKIGAALAKQQQANDKARKIFAVTQSETNKLLVQSREILTDETASIAAKKKALEEVTKAESASSKEKVRIAAEDLRILKEKAKALGGEAEKKMKGEIREATIALNEAETENAMTGIKLNKQRKMLLRQEVADAKEAATQKTENLKAVQDAEKEAIEKRFELEKLSFDERRKIVNEDKKLSEKDRKNFLDKINSEERKSVEEHNKAIADLNKRYDEEEENRLADTAVKKEELDYTRRVKEIESIAQTELEKQTLIEKLDTEHKARMTVAAKTDAEKKAADEKAIKDKQKAEEVKAEENKNTAIANSKQNLANIINGIETTGLAKTKAGQAISKALALTQIGIDSAVALSKASTLANAEGAAAQLAFPLVPGIGTIARVLSYTSTALSVASNIVRAKQLLSGGGGGGAASGGSSAPSPTGGGNAPQFNVVGATGVNQLAGAIANREQAPIETYVVANNVSTAMALDRNIIRSATLG